MIQKRLASVVAAAPFALVLNAGACNHEPKESAPDAAAASVPLAPPPEPSFHAVVPPVALEASRKLPARVARVNDRVATLSVNNQTDKQVARVVGWHYFYDSDKKCIDRGRQSCDIALAPSSTKECKVPLNDLDFLPRPAKTIEVEITQALDASGAVVWQNENLAPSCETRPLGGLSDDALRARTGVKFLTVYAGAPRERPLFDVKNTTEKRSDLLEMIVYYYDRNGNVLRAYESMPRNIGIEPGHYEEVEVGFARIDMPAGTASEDLVVWHARFEDGSEWTNANLRVLRHKPRE